MRTLLKDPDLFREAALVGGEWLATTAHGSYDLRNPASGERLARPSERVVAVGCYVQAVRVTRGCDREGRNAAKRVVQQD